MPSLRVQVFAWGCNSSGQLGLGDFVERRAPCEVASLWALPVVALAAGDQHSAALTTSGFLFTWGANDLGQLGLPKNADAASQARTPPCDTSALFPLGRLLLRRSCNQASTQGSVPFCGVCHAS